MKLLTKPLALILYADWLVLPRFAGMAVGPIVTIRPKFKHRLGLLEHELVHVRQFWRTFGLLPFFYFGSKKWRLKYEVEAYRAQLTHEPERLDQFARALANKYRLNVTVEEAKALLT